MHADRPREDTAPWYRQFWPWFIIALPASAVVAGLTTLYIATINRDTLVEDDYYKEGLAINEDLARAQRATELGITAELTYDARTGDVVLATTGVPDETRQLTLRFVHPTLAERDVSALVVRAADGRYRTQLSPLGPANWHVQLQPDGAEWRLEARLALPGNGQASLR
jgi:uncharacterized protein